MEFETNLDLIKQKLEDLKSQGFDSIHLPGGTSKDGSCSSLTVIPFLKNSQFFFVGVPYNSKARTNGHNKKLGETPEEIAIRETIEETALFIEAKNLHLLLDLPVNDNRVGHEGQIHHKYFYHVNEFTGTLFDFQGKPNPIDTETTTPLMIPAKLFLEVIFKGHLRAVQESIKYLLNDKDGRAMTDKSYSNGLMSLISLA